MNRSTYRFTLDLQKHRSQMSIAVFVHDSAVRLIISLTDGGIPYHIESGGRAVFYGKRPNDTPLCHNCMIDDTDRIIYDFNDQTASVEGITDCQIRIYGRSGELVSAPRFIIVADERPVNDADIEKQEDSPLAALDEIQFAEIERVDAETARAEAETARADSEAERITNEQARIDAEAVRIKNENERIDAEAERIKNEEARIEAETAQNQKISELEGNITDNERRLNEIEEHLAPKYIITDDKTAYRKDVPLNACSKAQLNSIGGMTYVDEATNTFVDAKVTEIKGIGANKLGGTALSSAILSNVEGSHSYEGGKRIGFPCTNAKGFRYTDFKPNTEYTFIFYGYNSKSEERYSNLTLRYTDNKTIVTVSGNSSFLFETAGTPSYAIAYSDPSKSVSHIAGSYETGTTYLYPDKCGIFEGHVTLEEFQAYKEETIFQIPAEIQALPNYGKMFTEVDLVNKKYYNHYHKAMDVAPMSFEVTSNADGSYDYAVYYIGNLASNYQRVGTALTTKPYTKIVPENNSANFTLYGNSSEDLSPLSAYEVGQRLFGDITVVAYTDDRIWLGEEVEHDISAYIDNNIIEVTAGGAIEFVNDGKKAVPSSVSYMMGGHLLEKEV